MSESENSQKKFFKKQDHRPWDSTIFSEEEESIEDNINEDIDFEDRVEQEEHIVDTNIDAEELINQKSTEQSIEEIKRQIESQLAENKKNKEDILFKLNNKSDSKLLIGGFFQPNSTLYELNSKHGKQVSDLLSDLNDTEKDILILSSNLESAQALDKAEKSELSMKVAEKSRELAEKKANSALMQAHENSKQIQTLLDKIAKLNKDLDDEKALRKEAEEKEKLAYQELNLSHINAKNSFTEKKKAEEKMQQALDKTVEIEIERRKMESAYKKHEQVVVEINQKILSAEKDLESERINNAKLNEQLNDTRTKVDILMKNNKELQSKSEAKAVQLKEMENRMTVLDTENKLKEKEIDKLTSSQENLQKIVATERNLRKIAETKSKDIKNEIEDLKKEMQEEIRKRKAAEEKTKIAVKQAHSAMMNLLDDSHEYKSK